MSGVAALSAPGRIARAQDPDRFLAALLAPAARREALFALIAFGCELRRAAAIGRGGSEHGGFGGLIRLQWWREILDGAVRRHEVATPVAGLIAADPALIRLLEPMVVSAEREVEGLRETPDWQEAIDLGPGHQARAWGRIVGAPADCEGALGEIGAAYGAGLGLLGRGVVPPAELARAPAIADGRSRLARGLADLRGRLPRAARSASLLAPLAARDLARAARGGPGRDPAARPLGDRLAVMARWAMPQPGAGLRRAA